MPHPLTVVQTWQSCPPSSLEARTVVILDILRWSTTALTALDHGAARVEAFATPDEALARAAELGRGNVVLGGERQARRIDGFDLGNSPAEYTRERVAGRVVLTTTTNGTQALRAARAAREVMIGAFVNLDAIVAACARALQGGRAVTLLCAGQDGHATLEDSCCAGAMVDRLLALGAVREPACDPVARAVREEWVSCGRLVAEVMTRSPHAEALRREGFGDDVAWCGRVSVYTVREASGVRGEAVRAASGAGDA